MTIPSSRSLIFEVKSTGSELAFGRLRQTSDVYGRLRTSSGIFGNDRVVLKNPSTPRMKISRLYLRKSWQVYKCSKVMKSLKILIIISLIAYNNKEFLTLTSASIYNIYCRLNLYKTIINSKHDTERAWLHSKCDFSYVPDHEVSKHVHNTFFIAVLPNKRSSLLEKTIRIFPLAAYTSKALEYFIQLWKRPLFSTHLNHRSSNKITRHVWAIVVTSLSTKLSASSRAPFEPMEKCEMKFRLVSSNSRGLSLARAKFTLWDCSFILMLTHETCFQSYARTISQLAWER